MRPYQYRCKDYSLLTPPFKQWVITPLIKIVPWAIPANIITLISNCFVYLGLYLSLNPELAGKITPIYISACLLIYLIGDHLDGMQAKRTGTGSALGEFCDHYLDAFNNGIIVYTMLVVFNVQHSTIVSSVIVISYVAHMAVFYEQFKTGWLTFEKIGSLEGVLMSCVLIGLSVIDSFYTSLTTPIFWGLSAAAIIIIGSAIGALSTFIQTYLRTPDVKAGYWIFIGLLTTIGVVGLSILNDVQVFTALTLYASLYIGKLMYGHLIDGFEVQPDWLMPFALTLYAIFGLSNPDYIFWIGSAYLAARIITLIVKTFSVLGIYWVWQNARV
ncbi:MAG TPA: CDP-alcohol phosphatidyltransferase family protein [Chryseolinea sp.]|nr:CDP-alcohol phosphatidyltransferase family protein [Chryseolinea sp.]